MSSTSSTTFQKVDLSFWISRDTWHWQEIRKYVTDSGTYMLRANICRNFYEFQSYARVEFFSMDKGWITVASHPATDYPCWEVKTHIKSLTGRDHEAFTETTDVLFDIGEKFFGISVPG